MSLPKILLGSLLFLIVAGIVFFAMRKPRHDRPWMLGQENLPFIYIAGDRVTIENLRDFAWTEPLDSTKPNYVKRELLLSDISGVEVVISHFSTHDSVAHTFLNFVLKNGENIGFSVEARREKGEPFSVVKGLFNEFEMQYIVGTSADLIGLRLKRNEAVYVYPTIASPERSQQLFLLLTQEVNAIFEHPVFYNTFTRNCTNTLARHVRALTGITFSTYYTTLAPGKIDEALYKNNLIPTEDSLEATRKRFLIRSDEFSP